MTNVAVFADMWGGRGVVVPNDDGGATFIPSEIMAVMEGEPWVVTMIIQTDLTADGPTAEITELKLTKRDGGKPIKPDLIRGMRIGEAMRTAIHDASSRLERVQFNNGGEGWRLAADHIPKARQATSIERVIRQKQRNSKVDEQVEQAAQAYRAAAGDKYNAVAQALGVSRATAARRIALAREQGLLTEAD